MSLLWPSLIMQLVMAEPAPAEPAPSPYARTENNRRRGQMTYDMILDRLGTQQLSTEEIMQRCGHKSLGTFRQRLRALEADGLLQAQRGASGKFYWSRTA